MPGEGDVQTNEPELASVWGEVRMGRVNNVWVAILEVSVERREEGRIELEK